MEQATSHQSGTPPRDARGLWLSLAGNAFARVGGGAITAMLLIYQARLGVDPEVVGFVAVAFYLTELTLAPVFGGLIDRRGWRMYMLLGPILAGVAALLTWGTAYIGGTLALILLVVSRLLNGVGIASNAPATLAFLSAYAGDDAAVRAKAVGYFELATIGGVAVGGLVGSLLFGWLGPASFLATLLIFGLSALAYAAVPAQLPGAHPVTDHHPGPLAMFGIKELWTFAPAWIVVNAIVGIWLNNLSNQLSQPCAAPVTQVAVRICRRFGHQFLVGDFTPATVGFVLAAFAVLFCLGILIWIRLLAKMRQSDAMLIALGGSFAVCVATSLINRLPDASGGLLLIPLLLLVAAALMVLSGFTPAALGILVEMAERNVQNRGVIMGAYSVLLGVGQFLGGSLGGFFASRLGVNGLILLTVIFTIIGTASVFWYRRTEPAFDPTVVRAH